MIIFKILVSLIAIEFLFRICYRLKCGSGYIPEKKIKWEDNYIVPHPFLSFSYKKNSVIKLRKLLKYSLRNGRKYYSFETPLKINNFGHFGNDFEEKKENGILRIACLGNSTTSNNISYEKKDYCYPDILQEFLQSKISLFKKHNKVEVYNFGIGGWVSQDILIDFFLNVIRAKPDYIIFCHGWVDVPFHLMDGFSNDYYHGRYNLGEIIKNIKYVQYLPKISFWKLYEFIKTTLFGVGNVRDDIMLKIRKQKTNNIDNDLSTLKYELDIIKNIFIICKYYNIKIIASTYPFYNFMKTKLSNKMEQGVQKENENIKKLSKEFNTIFIDHDKLVPKNDIYFLDWVHFTPQGMQFLAENYSRLILDDIMKGNTDER